MKFPTIHTIEDVLPHIKDFPEILVVEKEDFIWVDYVVDTGETFSRNFPGWEMRRECRGLFFDKNGMIISRPFHKFFNVGQLEENQPNLINLDDDHKIMVKEDGSMVRPFLIDGHPIRWGTRKGESETIVNLRKDFPDMFGEDSYDCHSQRYQQMFFQLEMNHTPIYEYVGPRNRHVVEYTKPQLILLALRDNITGEYYDIHDQKMFMYANDVVDIVESPKNISELIEAIRVLKGSEGVVISFGNSMHKIKADEYVLMHRAKDDITKERLVWQAIIDGNLDDVYPLLSEFDVGVVKEKEKEFWHLFTQKKKTLEDYVVSIRDKYETKKDYATSKENHDKSLNGFVFGFFDGKKIDDMLTDHIRKNINQDSKQAELKKWMEV